MWRIGVPNPHLNAFIPAGGYLLSTLSISVVKSGGLQDMANRKILATGAVVVDAEQPIEKVVEDIMKHNAS